MNINHDDVWGVTVEINIRYKKPVPLDQELRVVGRIINQRSRMYEGTGEILLPDGEVAVEGYGKYIRLPLEQIADFDYDEQEWKAVIGEDDPQEIELP
jgi:acyl-CoA thioesterase FadM